MMKPYDDERTICDHYDITQSLKQNMRAKRAQRKEMEFTIHDEMDIDKIIIIYKGSKKSVVVVKGTTVQINQPHSLAELICSRSLLENATRIDRSTFVRV